MGYPSFQSNFFYITKALELEEKVPVELLYFSLPVPKMCHVFSSLLWRDDRVKNVKK